MPAMFENIMDFPTLWIPIMEIGVFGETAFYSFTVDVKEFRRRADRLQELDRETLLDYCASHLDYNLFEHVRTDQFELPKFELRCFQYAQTFNAFQMSVKRRFNLQLCFARLAPNGYIARHIGSINCPVTHKTLVMGLIAARPFFVNDHLDETSIIRLLLKL